MELVAPLIAGIQGASNGTAYIYERGTGTPAAWSTAFEGGQTYTTPILLDGYGGAEVYVSQLVDVDVRDNTGTTIRQFTAGQSADNTELISTAFTGADYSTGVGGTSKPLTVRQAMDLWLASAGTTDFKVLVNGVATLLVDAVAGRQFYNVKDAVYGALGDNAKDDTVSIQAALDAAHAAGGGVVFFPAGTYRTTAALTWYSDVSLLGVNCTTVSIALDHATANMFTASGANSAAPGYVMGLSFNHIQACTGVVFDLTAAAREELFIGCRLGGGDYSRGLLISGGSGTVVRAYGCRFNSRAAQILTYDLRVVDCTFLFSTVAALTASMVKATALLTLKGCSFFPVSATASTLTIVEASANATALISGCVFNPFGATTTGTCITQGASGNMTVTGCFFGAKGSATAATAMAIATGASFTESGNAFDSTIAALSPDMVPYAYTTSTSGANQCLGSREFLRTATTQAGGGTKTVATETYGNVFVNITDNTGFTLNLALAPVGATAYVVLLATNGAGSGTIAWGANIYGSPTTGFTIATGKARMYTFRAELVNATFAWVIVGNVGYGGDL